MCGFGCAQGWIHDLFYLLYAQLRPMCVVCVGLCVCVCVCVCVCGFVCVFCASVHMHTLMGHIFPRCTWLSIVAICYPGPDGDDEARIPSKSFSEPIPESSSASDQADASPAKRTRCFVCRKKVGLTGNCVCVTVCTHSSIPKPLIPK